MVEIHRYDHWKIAGSRASINENRISVIKDGIPIPKCGASDCFTYLGDVSRNTRYAPTPGEQETGHMIALSGTARVNHHDDVYPECISATTSDRPVEYCHVYLDTRPDEDTVRLTINGQEVPKDESNGWTLLPERMTKSFRCDETGESKSGYFLRLNGSARYSDGSHIRVKFLPAGSE